MRKFVLTINFAVEIALADSHAVGAEAGRLGRPLRELRRREADVRAVTVQRQAVVGGLRLPVGVVNLMRHRKRTVMISPSMVPSYKRSPSKRSLV